jgi:hypothetical protein
LGSRFKPDTAPATVRVEADKTTEFIWEGLFVWHSLSAPSPETSLG